MKGIIRQNMGGSRYIVGVPFSVQPLQDEIKRYEGLYDESVAKVAEADATLAELKVGYLEAMTAVDDALQAYFDCRNDYSSANCIANGNSKCISAYFEAEDKCYEIESGLGECDLACWAERERCFAVAERNRDACLAKVGIECAEAEMAHYQACQSTHSPLIATAQTAALALLPPIQEALYALQTEQANQFALARRLTLLNEIGDREWPFNCFRAQYDAKLEAGTEVEMVRTPNQRTIITGIITAPTPCLHDARALPAGHLFVNAALFPGFETWRPTWRVGTVKEVIAPKLKIEFATAVMAGSLGTLYSENPINCTPPKSYFDGKDPKEAEQEIVTKRQALKEAQQALLDAVQVQNECIAVYDQAWMDQCYGDAVDICDQSYDTSMEQPALDKGDCYSDAQGTCEEQTAAGLEGCSEAHQPDIDDAQSALDAATAILSAANDDLIAAQNALAAIEAEIQECVDGVNTQEWLDDERDRLTGLCAAAADDRKQECLDNGNTAAECQIVRDAIYADCVALIDEQLPLRQAAARDKCQDDRQAEVDAAEIAIAAAFTAVNNAEIAMAPAANALEDAQEALRECREDFVLGDCLASALQLCDDTYDMAGDAAILQRAACYQEAMAECDRQRDEAIDACYAAHADAIDAAQTAVDEATRDVEIATNGRYNPADPLILDCPVAHCSPASYFVGDEVLIDFPVRSGAAMDVWNSRRVIGWATETRKCIMICRYLASGGLRLLGEEQISPTEVTQEIPVGENGTSVAVINDDNIVFWKWDDDTEENPQRENPRVDEAVEEGFTVTAVPIVFPEQVIGWLHWNIMLPNYSSGDIGSQVIEENKITNTFSGEIDTDYPGGEWRNHFYGWAIGSSRIVLSTNAPGDFEIAGMQNGYILIHEAIADLDVPEDPYGTITGNSIWYSPAGNSIWPTTLPWRKEIADITRGWRSGYNYAIGLYSQEFMTTDELMNDIGGQKSLTLIHKESGVSKIYNYSHVSSYDQSLVYL